MLGVSAWGDFHDHSPVDRDRRHRSTTRIKRERPQAVGRPGDDFASSASRAQCNASAQVADDPERNPDRRRLLAMSSGQRTTASASPTADPKPKLPNELLAPNSTLSRPHVAIQTASRTTQSLHRRDAENQVTSTPTMTQGSKLTRLYSRSPVFQAVRSARPVTDHRQLHPPTRTGEAVPASRQQADSGLNFTISA